MYVYYKCKQVFEPRECVYAYIKYVCSNEFKLTTITINTTQTTRTHITKHN